MDFKSATLATFDVFASRGILPSPEDKMAANAAYRDLTSILTGEERQYLSLARVDAMIVGSSSEIFDSLCKLVRARLENTNFIR